MRAAVRELFEEGMTQAEVAARLGVAKTTVLYHARRLDVPIDHRFGRRYDWREIQKAYDAGLSVRQCAARFGFNLASWSAAVDRGAIAPRPRGMPIEVLLVSDRPQTSRSHLRRRLILTGLKENRCERCGISDWQGKPLNMALHHINGDGRDNRLENIAFLCPNCHAQTPNYGGKGGRRRMSASPAGG
jgi:5-methylcytosine-specific restriction endonuclease McrA